ncbi:alpha-L-rhamnosidase [Actinobacteria bacterium YIM 96077]|uniref:alpha-L-rhamnosidase n=1 Tax=Phytoactinopolyspora halophila TaxID=1981511 RepID=A0A329QLE4_9ACTN|nr:alpha-L-rhamnosidase [Phytoactinopolyspora halophila]AYY12568.1 alpha-L-rhamnosidase [Actinobacteria bacterium YIM 96077]RAW12529.1 alpha-L-rhamnosidase [Phytoactinopolyspora halophila]
MTSYSTAPQEAPQLTPFGLMCDHRVTPLGIDEPRPRLSWKLASDRRGDRQVGYRVVVMLPPDHLNGTGRVVWDTDWRDGDATAVDYDGAPLQSSTRYRWQVSVRDTDGRITETAESWFETALLHGEWDAAWIAHDPLVMAPMEPPQDDDRSERTRHLQPAPFLRRAFDLDARPARARAYVTARGLYELRINGERVGDAELAPGWTDYHRRIPYQVYDVGHLVNAGSNVVGAVLGDGWWCGYIGFDSRRHAQHYGEFPELIAQLVFDFHDGSRLTLGTDGTWRETDSPIRYADLLMGEYVDARTELAGWDRPGYDDSSWSPVLVTSTHTDMLEAASDEPIRVVEKLAPVRVDHHPDGTAIVDLGQNMVGRVRLTIRGAGPGQRIKLRFAEMLDADGSVYLDNLRTAEATDVYIARGAESETFEPRFALHGFRYVEISGYPGHVSADDVSGMVLANDIPWTGSFTCSDRLTNQLVSNVAWSQRGNFVAVPTDCPQRDERLGWTADAQIFLPTAMRQADVAAFITRWLRDVVDGQHPDGAFPDVIPEIAMTGPGAPAWGDAGVIIPWLIYQEHGDDRVLRRCFPAMRRWVDYIHRHNPDLVWRHRTGRHYADWLQVDAATSRDVLATAYFARSTELVSRAAAALGQDDVAEDYTRLRGRIADAFARAFVDGDGRVEGDTQTGYLLALSFDLLPADLRPWAAKRLIEDVESRGSRLTTGFVGVALLCPTLCAIGRPDLAYDLLHQEDYPSWNYSILHGATTIWERWDGWTQEYGFQSAEMNSFNHYSLGSIGDWLYGWVAGLRQAEDSTAWRRILIAPLPGGKLHSAAATQITPRGLVSTDWQLTDGTLDLHVQIPPGDAAEVRLPTGDPHSVQLNGDPVAVADMDVQSGYISTRVEPGQHHITARAEHRHEG